MRSHALILVLSLCGVVVGPALGQVGEPTGFTITVIHGGTVVANKAVTIGPGGDIDDTKTNDGDPEGFTQIGTLPPGPGGSSPIIMKVVTGDDPMFRLLHIFINAPVSLSDIHTAGPFSLFNPANSAPIHVAITNAAFSGTTFVAPLLVNNNTFYTAFMRDKLGRFYELPQANAFNAHGNGIIDIQVPGEKFLDGSLPYAFASFPGPVGAWVWGMIPNPGPGTTIHNGTIGGQPSAGAGYVFELGLGVAFWGIPEPTTLTLLLGGLMLAARRRR